MEQQTGHRFENVSGNKKKALDQITDHLENGIISFWLERGIDQENGGYLTCFDNKGNPTEDTIKIL